MPDRRLEGFISHYTGFSSIGCIHKQFEQVGYLYTKILNSYTFRLPVLFLKSFMTSQRLRFVPEQTSLKSSDDMVQHLLLLNISMSTPMSTKA